MGQVEWVSLENGERWTAVITKCVNVNGNINIVFENEDECFEGRFSFTQDPGDQTLVGQYRSTIKGYEGPAEVVGSYSNSDSIGHFSGTWHDDKDGTGMWKFFVEVDSIPKYIFTYDERTS